MKNAIKTATEAAVCIAFAFCAIMLAGALS
jgi:hypothetical protein